MFCNRTCRSRYWQATPKEERDRNRELLRTVKPKSASVKEYTCKYCGKSFEGYTKKPRNYCSRPCSYAAHSYEGDGRRVDIHEIPAGPELWEKALRMHYEGILTAEIARQLGCPGRTAALWINHGKKLQLNPDVYHKNEEPHFRYIYASNADVWIKVLRDEMSKTGAPHMGSIIDGKSVRLICGTINTHKSADNLAVIVAEKFKLNPYDGNYFAFCGKSREYIRYIRWDGGGFQMTIRQRERGLYVWPPARMGATVTVTAEEFEFILSGSNTDKI
jgi:transposase